MTKKITPSDLNVTGPVKSTANTSKVLGYCNKTMSEYFKMQQENDKSIRKLISVQEKLIAASIAENHTVSVTGESTDPPYTEEALAMKKAQPAELNITRDYKKNESENLAKKTNVSPEKSSLSTSSEKIKRYLVKPVPAIVKKASEKARLSPDYAVLLIGKNPDLIKLLEKSLSRYPNPVFHIVPGRRTMDLGDKCYEVNLSDSASIEEFRTLILKSVPGIAVIINLLGLTKAYEGKGLLDPYISDPELSVSGSSSNAGTEKSDDDNLHETKKLFLFLQVFMKELKNSAKFSEAWLINFSFMDGQFGLKKENCYSLGQAGCVGLIKAVSREYPSVRVKCIDINPSAAPIYVIARVRQELREFDDELEVGLDGKKRFKLTLAEEIPLLSTPNTLDLDSDSVILATGGAYGIVSEILHELTDKFGTKVIIIGRSPLPGPEPADTVHLKTHRELQQYLIDKMKKESNPVSPGILLKQIKNIMKERQIRANIERYQKRSSVVEYHAMDVRDTDLFISLLEDIYKRYGRIDGIIHGAGVIQDKLIEAKSFEAFSTVFDTKVLPASALSKKIQPETLKFLVFFSSIAARFGNMGQTDYCSANEVLNKLANHLDSKWRGRIVAINWGPWDYGMVSDDLRKLFSERGIEMIPVRDGVEMFFNELNLFGKPDSEVLISGSPNI